MQVPRLERPHWGSTAGGPARARTPAERVLADFLVVAACDLVPSHQRRTWTLCFPIHKICHLFSYLLFSGEGGGHLFLFEFRGHKVRLSVVWLTWLFEPPVLLAFASSTGLKSIVTLFLLKMRLSSPLSHLLSLYCLLIS